MAEPTAAYLPLRLRLLNRWLVWRFGPTFRSVKRQRWVEDHPRMARWLAATAPEVTP